MPHRRHSPLLLVLPGFKSSFLLGIVIAFAAKSWYGCGHGLPKNVEEDHKNDEI